ncbi:dTDP-glucose 4,6-dehydratase [Streptomyces sp. 6N223]|uniref:dTDP-glucose 4,6-dehydratase n=1 Tax=Streptomyces sp. 6N223 TaxID=3457412 RepID=UPI003FD56489
MNVLVTGGAGFIGSAFVRHLLAGSYPCFADARVVVFDKLTYAGNLGNLDPVIADPRLTFVRGDICDRRAVERVMRGATVVVHFAAESHVDRSIADADAFVRTNVSGSYEVLRAALRADAESCVLVSTDEVFGEIESGSWDEGAPLLPNSPYAASKASAELLARSFHRTHGLPVRIARLSNGYGPYQYPEKLIPLFVTSLLDGRTVPLYGDGGNERQWLHVDDHCRAIALIAGRGLPGHAYNVGGGRAVTNIDLTRALLELTGADWSQVRFVPDRKGHDRRYALDGSKLQEELGFRPSIEFRTGLAGTVRWYAENRKWWEPLRKGKET